MRIFSIVYILSFLSIRSGIGNLHSEKIWGILGSFVFGFYRDPLGFMTVNCSLLNLSQNVNVSLNILLWRSWNKESKSLKPELFVYWLVTQIVTEKIFKTETVSCSECSSPATFPFVSLYGNYLLDSSHSHFPKTKIRELSRKS